MRVRTLLIVTAIVSSLLGAFVVWLVLSVPNDIRANALLKEARQDIAAGKNDDARESLSRVIQQYPRTDAAAAATVALVTLNDKNRTDFERAITYLKTKNDQQEKSIEELQQVVLAMKNAPKPAPVAEPAPKVETKVEAKPAPKPPAKKKTTTKKSTRTRRRHR